MENAKEVVTPEPAKEVTPESPKVEDVVTMPRAAEICKAEGIGLSYRQLRGLVMSNRLPHFKNGKRHYVSMKMLRKVLEDMNSPLWADSLPE